jgi:hypothetical protein
MSIVDNKNGDPMVKFLFEVREPEGSKKAIHNGSGLWGQQNATAEGAQFMNGLLFGIGLPQADVSSFWGVGPLVEKPDASKREKMISIGKTKIDPDGMPCTVNAAMGQRRQGPDGTWYEAKMEVKSFLVPVGTNVAAPAEELEDEEEDDAVESVEDDVEEIGEAEDDEEEDDPADERIDELEKMRDAGDRVGLVRIAKSHGIKVVKSYPEDKIIDLIIEVEFPQAEDAEEEEEVEVVEPEPEPEPAATAPRRSAARRTAGTTAPPF